MAGQESRGITELAAPRLRLVAADA